jgi:hypothetical protein
VSIVRSGREGRGVAARELRYGVADEAGFVAEVASGVEFGAKIEAGVDRDVGKEEAGTSDCMLPPTRPGGGGDKTWFVSTS